MKRAVNRTATSGRGGRHGAARRSMVRRGGAGVGSTRLSAHTAAVRAVLQQAVTVPATPAERVAQLHELGRLKRAVAAAEAYAGADFIDATRQSLAEQNVPQVEVDRVVRVEVCLARQESPHLGSRFIGFSQVLVRDLPITMAALWAGEISERSARDIVRDVVILSPEGRAWVDSRLAGRLVGSSEHAIERLVRALSMTVDPKAWADRLGRAVAERRVGSSPAPDVMANLRALLPAEDAVAVIAALHRAADTARACGDPRTRGQVMADTLVERITGRRAAHHQHEPDAADLTPEPEVTDLTPQDHPTPQTADPVAGEGGTDTVRDDSSCHDDGDARSAGAGFAPVDHHADCNENPVLSGSSDVVGEDHEAACHDDGDPADPGQRRVFARDPVADSPGMPRQQRPRLRPGDVLPGYSPDPDPRRVPAPSTPQPAHGLDASGAPTQRPDIVLNLVMTDTALFGASDTPATLDGDVIPAWLARDLVTDPRTTVALRRLFAHPTTKQLVQLDSTARLFTGVLRQLVTLRDRRCAMPWCGARIRHADHARPHHVGGATHADNGRGFCEHCNYLKEALGLTTELVPNDHRGAPPTLRILTASGQVCDSTIPPVLDAITTSEVA